MSGNKRKFDPFGARDTLQIGPDKVGIYRLSKLEDAGLTQINTLPYSIRVLLESLLRNCDDYQVTEQDVKNLSGWNASDVARQEIPFKPARVILQDFTGVPAVVDLAAMRNAMARLGGDPKLINPLIPVDLVVDHSVQVDQYGTPDAAEFNTNLEFKRNRERYEFLRWGQKAFNNFRTIPPSTGIIHQVNLEHLAKCVVVRYDASGAVALPDTLVGTDSHTTMINGLGIVGWGVGGIEAEAVMLGQPLYMLMPEVIGLELTGELRPGVTATDLVLTVTESLRREGVVGKFVEYFGPGTLKMNLTDRAVLANMCPEYGATIGFFPIDDISLNYLRKTGRTETEIQLVDRYAKEQQLFRSSDAPTPNYTKTISFDLGSVEPSLAGPKRPQDRIALSSMKEKFQHSLKTSADQGGFGLSDHEIQKKSNVVECDRVTPVGHGVVVIASITSCTNTSNPSLMIAAGLLAKNAVKKGLGVKSYVKTSLAPGSRVVTEYLSKSGLDKPLNALGFETVGYGCATCIGNSGPIPKPTAKAITDGNLVASAVLSGNRNFEGRISPLVKANYLASPPLVVAYAIAGTIEIDLVTEPIGQDTEGEPVFLRDIWPSNEQVEAVASESVQSEMFRRSYSNVFDANQLWNEIPVNEGDLFEWNPDSTYVQEPPFLVNLAPAAEKIKPIQGARILAVLGDSVTTDHISPAGAIAPDSPAGKYLQSSGVKPSDFNSYGSRRGNDRVMTRGTLANTRIRNLLTPGVEGGFTCHLLSTQTMPIYDAAIKYKDENVPLIILAGSEYGTGSSRDWAAKGTRLLGVRAVIASSFERIHRSNLVGMGVLPLELEQSQSWESLGLSGKETFDFVNLDDSLQPGDRLKIIATATDGSTKEFEAIARIDTPVELEYYRNGGILQTVLRKLLNENM